MDESLDIPSRTKERGRDRPNTARRGYTTRHLADTHKTMTAHGTMTGMYVWTLIAAAAFRQV
jgi:hypothetical protein